MSVPVRPTYDVHAIHIRNIGLMGAIDLEPRPGKPRREPATIMTTGCYEGATPRITGDTLAMSPPLIVTREQIDEIMTRVGAVLDALA